MSLWQIPTTLLSQVDSSVGGKTGINLSAGKNQVGTFYQPNFVVTDPETLRTLPDEEYVGGLGEVVKYALLEGEEFLSLLESNTEEIRRRDAAVMGAIVHMCVEYKAGVVEEDEFDKAGRAVLNLGHTTAHALEKSLGYGRIGHGQAVGLGLLTALELSEKLLGLDSSVQTRTRDLLAALGLPVKLALPSADALLEAASRDKKVTASSTGFVCLAALGAPVWGINVTSSEFVSALEKIAE
jgi:3-dehydroquinate synthase